MSAFEKSVRLSLLEAGRRPTWRVQADTDPALGPQGASAGVGLNVGDGNATQTLLLVRVRRTVSARTATVVVSTVDLTDTYELILGGTSVTYDADAEGATDAEDILTGLKAAIEANGTTNALVTATVTTATDADPVLTIVGKASSDYAVDFSTAGGGELTVEADAVSCTATPWVMATVRQTDIDLEPYNTWARTTQAALSVTSSNIAVQLDTAGYARLFVQVTSVTGHASDGASVTKTVIVFTGPCDLE